MTSHRMRPEQENMRLNKRTCGPPERENMRPEPVEGRASTSSAHITVDSANLSGLQGAASHRRVGTRSPHTS
jgi:hypothetical protein